MCVSMCVCVCVRERERERERESERETVRSYPAAVFNSLYPAQTPPLSTETIVCFLRGNS
jgi:hypothetical protein